MKLILLSLLVSGTMSAAISGTELDARQGPDVSCSCSIIFPNRADSVVTKFIPAKPGLTTLPADYRVPLEGGGYNVTKHACQVGWNRGSGPGSNPLNCAAYTQGAGPDGPNCPPEITRLSGGVTCSTNLN